MSSLIRVVTNGKIPKRSRLSRATQPDKLKIKAEYKPYTTITPKPTEYKQAHKDMANSIIVFKQNGDVVVGTHKVGIWSDNRSWTYVEEEL